MMNKLPTKQIYLLSIIVLGIVSLSIYSTYAIFTFEAETSNILSINTPGALSLNEKISKYKQITVAKNTYTTTDVDIYNNYNYDICYGIWYKTDNKDVKVYEKNDTLTANGLIKSNERNRVTLIIINDSEKNADIKIGLSHGQSAETCELNIESDKKQVTSTLDASKTLISILEEVTEKELESGYVEYKESSDKLTFPIDNKLIVATEFEYKDEVFTLKEPVTYDFKENNNSLDKTYYTCLGKDTCQTLYKIDELIIEDDTYSITKYDKYFGYSGGKNGIRKINNNYYFYGDNPDNYIYYDCQNELDPKTCSLWRIIGLIYDEKENKYLTKIIRNDYLTKLKYASESEMWEDSDIKKYLEEEYKLNDSAYLQEITFKQENLQSPENENGLISPYGKDIKNKFHIVNLSDYLNTSICTDKRITEYTAECLTNNWLNKYQKEWTMTMHYIEPTKDPETEELIPVENNKIYTIGPSIETAIITDEFDIRPVVYLKNRMLVINGDGSFSNPYIIR